MNAALGTIPLLLLLLAPAPAANKEEVIKELSRVLPHLTEASAESWVRKAGPAARTGVVHVLDQYLEARGLMFHSVADSLLERVRILNGALVKVAGDGSVGARIGRAAGFSALEADLMVIARKAYNSLYDSDWRSIKVRWLVRQVLAVDPLHPVANAALARWYAQRVLNRSTVDPGDLRRARAAIEAGGASATRPFEFVSSEGFVTGMLAEREEDGETKSRYWREAEKLHLEALELGHSFPEHAWSDVACCRWKVGDVEGAENALREAICCDAAAVRPHSLFGLILYDQKRLSEALEMYFKAIELGSDSVLDKVAILELLVELSELDQHKEKAKKILDEVKKKGASEKRDQIRCLLASGKALIGLGSSREGANRLHTAARLSDDPLVWSEYARNASVLGSRGEKSAWEGVLESIDKLKSAERKPYKKLRAEAKKKVAGLEREIARNKRKKKK